MVYIVFGVAGAGKTEVSKFLSKKINCPYYDGDDYHPKSNKEKMKNGIALDDEDRKEWLDKLSKLVIKSNKEYDKTILACSALKEKYRDILSSNKTQEVLFIHLNLKKEIVARRLKNRENHFFNAELLDSQYETLEKLDEGIIIDADQSLQSVCNDIINKMQ